MLIPTKILMTLFITGITNLICSIVTNSNNLKSHTVFKKLFLINIAAILLTLLVIVWTL